MTHAVLLGLLQRQQDGGAPVLKNMDLVGAGVEQWQHAAVGVVLDDISKTEPLSLKSLMLIAAGVEQWPYAAVGVALEVIPRTLAQNCGANVIRCAHSRHAPFLGKQTAASTVAAVPAASSIPPPALLPFFSLFRHGQSVSLQLHGAAPPQQDQVYQACFATAGLLISEIRSA